MAEEKKFDPFRPPQPRIPGIPERPATQHVEEPPAPVSFEALAERRTKPARPSSATWAILTLAAAVITCGGLWYWNSTFAPRRAANAPETTAAVPAMPAFQATSREAQSPPLERGLPVGPGVIATTEELSKPWSAKRFLFRGPLSAEPLPAMVVRLPDSQYWGFSLQEPFGSCELDYLTDLAKIASDYNFHATHPMLGDPCTRAVYDLARYGQTGPDGSLVRGAIVQGTGTRPPLEIEIRVRGNQVSAVRME